MTTDTITHRFTTQAGSEAESPRGVNGDQIRCAMSRRIHHLVVFVADRAEDLAVALSWAALCTAIASAIASENARR